MLCSSCLDQQNITVFYHVVLALGHNFPCSLDGWFVPVFFEGVVVVNDGLNKGLLKVYNQTSQPS